MAERFTHADVRLIVLTGPGGTGKTRLGLQVGEAAYASVKVMLSVARRSMFGMPRLCRRYFTSPHPRSSTNRSTMFGGVSLARPRVGHKASADAPEAIRRNRRRDGMTGPFPFRSVRALRGRREAIRAGSLRSALPARTGRRWTRS